MKKALFIPVLMLISAGCWLSRGTTLSPTLLAKAKQEYRARSKRLSNPRYLTIIDYSKNILQDRLFVYDLQQQQVVLQTRVSHAFKSGILYPTRFSNTDGSEKTCTGTFITGETYAGKYGYSMRVDGISASNTQARARAVVFHPGYTWSAACFMTTPEVNERLINLIKNKSLLLVCK